MYKKEHLLNINILYIDNYLFIFLEFFINPCLKYKACLYSIGNFIFLILFLSIFQVTCQIIFLVIFLIIISTTFIIIIIFITIIY